LGRFEMERGARLSGSRFGYLVGDTARLALALYRWAIDRAVAEGFVPVIPPVLVREEAMYGTGFFPAERFEIYEVADEGLYLTGTSEVALAGLHMGEILEADALPVRYSGFSTNFRREAGAAGRDTRGMFRVHQFNKVEMFSYVLPDESWDEHTLNGTAVTDRWALAVLENFQDEGGKVTVPEALTEFGAPPTLN